MTRSRTLDIMRFVAVALVLGRHLDICPVETNRYLYYVTLVWQRGGWMGVDLFFVLSGFLISGLLFKEHQRHGRIAIKNFLLRRGFKIYPAFYVLFVITLCKFLFTFRDLPYPFLVRELFFLQNYGGGLWVHTWSLAVEEHFYLFLPFTLVLLARIDKFRAGDPFRNLQGLFVIVAIACLGLRIFITARDSFSYQGLIFPTHLRIDSLFFGVLISYYYHYRPQIFSKLSDRFRVMLLVVGGALLVPGFVFPMETAFYIPTFGLSLIYFGSGLILTAFLDREPKGTLFSRLPAYLGARSYSIYLWHMPVAAWGGRLLKETLPLGSNWYIYAVTYLIGSLIVGVLMAQIIELPVLRLRERFYSAPNRPWAKPAAVVGLQKKGANW